MSIFTLLQSDDDQLVKKRKEKDSQKPLSPSPYEAAMKTMCERLMKALDMRLRQVEGKEHFKLKAEELQHVLSILTSSSQLEGCVIYPPLLRRLLTRLMSNPEVWTEQDMVCVLCYPVEWVAL